ncbi:peptide ABC transporter substrate-binding protein [Roseomonas alkaliterrae]|uniref:Peptide/nickel transport system substrate-binding protein n=1 Tax=Neoroseomonas alkaliterrae TaxID=1452450 RepID=A0A840XMX8_9PROT|nr:peptide ABC transporter substrate-binding protein [Neoroseomonas alkaliterrae]MBB5688090.1 peptide/nickel transport system substrate-binding protein [Neoroseomonas alkaliterrae]MBR0674962.1 peptide ABC transporter substrate-binding protein [Neoroseomonas alkaliterrae]
MTEDHLRSLIGRVKRGTLSRRGFVRRVAALGLTAPMATQLLAVTGAAPAAAQAVPAFPQRVRGGGGGALRILYWQAQTLLNPHFAVGTTNQDGSRVFYEPLAGWASDGTLHPILAAEIPSVENRGLSEDGRAVTWKLKRGVKWHDGQDFTADDVVFNWEYGRNPATSAVTIGSYRGVNVVKVDDYTVRVEFERPTPFWADAFVGSRGMIIPRHVFKDYTGAASRDAPANIRPVGTGAYRFVSFQPGDTLRGEANPAYHAQGRPFFDTIEVKGGGDAASAARAVLQTGDYDFAWSLRVDDEILKRLEAAGRGQVSFLPTGAIEHIQLNAADPAREVDGERSHPSTQHPIFRDPAVRQAVALVVDRDSIQRFIYGRGGEATANFLNNPPRFRSPNMRYEFNIQRANEILDAAGWVRGRDGIRVKDGRRLSLLFQTSVSAPRQRAQAIIKQAAQRAGIEMELKSVVASVFFSSDVANPDTYTKFYADMQMYNTTMPQADPQLFMNQFTSWEVASQANRWQGRNITRWRNEEYDRIFRESEGEMDPVKRAALFIRMNDLIVGSNHVIPLFNPQLVNGHANNLRPVLSGWDNTFWLLRDWHRV